MDNGAISNNDVATLSLLGSGAYGFGNYGNFAYDGSVIKNSVDSLRAQSERAVDRIVDNQTLEFDVVRDNQRQAQDMAAEFRSSDRAAALDRLLFNQFNQIDRRFSDMALANQECCCELKAGQATIIAKLDCQEQVRLAVQQAEQGAKLDAIMAGLNNKPGQGN